MTQLTIKTIACYCSWTGAQGEHFACFLVSGTIDELGLRPGSITFPVVLRSCVNAVTMSWPEEVGIDGPALTAVMQAFYPAEHSWATRMGVKTPPLAMLNFILEGGDE